MTKTFLSNYLPYCLDRQEDGSFIILNRDYKRIAISNSPPGESNAVIYSLKKISKVKLQKISAEDGFEEDKIYLYKDKTNPLTSKENMKNYLKRIELLAGIFLSC